MSISVYKKDEKYENMMTMDFMNGHYGGYSPWCDSETESHSYWEPVFCLSDGDDIVGHVSGGLSQKDKRLVINGMYILEAHRSKGYAKKLVDSIILYTKSVLGDSSGVFVVVFDCESLDSLSFRNHMGFTEEVGRIKSWHTTEALGTFDKVYMKKPQ